MKEKLIFFVAFQEQDNLGIGYISSILLQSNFKVKIIDFRDGKEEILTQILLHNPFVVGFSIIFQYHIDDFKDLISYLRKNGVNSHFCAGGHYPSFRYSDLFKIIPQLDSIVLFEGEKTFLELAQLVYKGKEWNHIKGIAYRENGSIVVNKLRPLEENLDTFPLPVRQPLREYVLGKKYVTILAGRGCFYNCSFCSIKEFYSRPPGSIKRIRHPSSVVKEMELLFNQLDGTIFMFQDDDFPIAGKKGKEWITKFCEEIIKRDLNKKILWKINCRPDEVKSDVFDIMKNSGLFLVYLGIEAGTDSGLCFMNKHLKAETSIKAVTILKELGIQYDFGFMLFDPSSSFTSILENLNFLERLCGDGSSPITFCKMLPYAETRIERQLKEEGRLKGMPGFEDYDFNEISLDHLYSFTAICFKNWIAERDGILNLARWARYYLCVYQKYFPTSEHLIELHKSVYNVIAQSNLFFINTIRALVLVFNSQSVGNYDYSKLELIKKDVAKKHLQYQIKLNNLINEVESLIH